MQSQSKLDVDKEGKVLLTTGERVVIDAFNTCISYLTFLQNPQTFAANKKVIAEFEMKRDVRYRW